MPSLLHKMEHTVILRNITDADGDSVNLKIIFRAGTGKNTSAEAFDSKGRYYHNEYLPKQLNHFIERIAEIKNII